MVSPYVRRLRLAQELQVLRRGQGCSAGQLAHAVGMPRQRVSGIENCRVQPGDDELGRILDVLQVEPERREPLLAVAADARLQGWWVRESAAIGPRQALYADLEAGACGICEYQLTLLPGLLQIPAYTSVRARLDRVLYSDGFNPDRAVRARARRQSVLDRDDGPTYEVVIDELAVRRYAAPPNVVRDQVDYLAYVGLEHPRIDVRILPLTARIPGGVLPRSAFSIYRYPDPGDPVVVAVDTVSSDLVLTDSEQVTGYQRLYQQLSDAALSTADSFDFLTTRAEQLKEGPDR